MTGQIKHFTITGRDQYGNPVMEEIEYRPLSIWNRIARRIHRWLNPIRQVSSIVVKDD